MERTPQASYGLSHDSGVDETADAEGNTGGGEPECELANAGLQHRTGGDEGDSRADHEESEPAGSRLVITAVVPLRKMNATTGMIVPTQNSANDELAATQGEPPSSPGSMAPLRERRPRGGGGSEGARR